jgi:hypothetical protein
MALLTMRVSAIASGLTLDEYDVLSSLLPIPWKAMLRTVPATWKRRSCTHSPCLPYNLQVHGGGAAGWRTQRAARGTELCVVNTSPGPFSLEFYMVIANMAEVAGARD